MEITEGDSAGKQTLTQVIERLGAKCDDLRKLAELSEELYCNLNKTEITERDKIYTSQKLSKVGLMNLIAYNMEVHIMTIGKNLSGAIDMIE